jgi:hypothetical protein
MVLFNILRQEGAVIMQNLDPLTILLTILISFYAASKVFMYIRYKKSGKVILAVKLQKDVIIKFIWIAVAAVWLIPIIRTYLSGGTVTPEKLKSTIIWICFIGIVAYIENKPPKITEGGIMASGNFWSWKEVKSCNWRPGKVSVLLIEAKRAKYILRLATTLTWRVSPEQKQSITSLLKDKIKK